MLKKVFDYVKVLGFESYVS